MTGKFTGIVAVSVPDSRASALSEDLAALEATGLEVTVHPVDAAPVAAPHQELTLELFGPDHPGIIHDLSHALTVSGVSIAELSTETREAPMAGGVLFEARAVLHAPRDLSVQDLAQSLEDVANELSVDIDLEVHIDVGSNR
jgi:glycine cleavage system regulatory protein